MTTQKTRCPYCSSVFAVSNAQLAIRDGYTRCGKCFQVFKADDYLLTSNAPAAAGAEGEPSKPATLNPNANRSHIVDLHKIDSSRTKGFDKALDSFLEQKKLPLPSIIDFEHTKKKEKLDLAVLPNEHPEPETRDPLQPNPDAYLDSSLEEPLEPLNHEFNEEWLTETANPTNPLAQPTDEEDHTQSQPPKAKTGSLETTSDTSEPTSDEDLMSYLNQNNIPASNVNTKTNRALPSMNDFHANQRSKKKSKALPMPVSITKKNVTLGRLSSPKKWYKFDFVHVFAWGIILILMAGLLVAQYIFFNFDRLAANTKYQPFMHKACLMVGCDVPLIDLSKIQMSNVVAGPFQPSPQDSTIFTATMTNKASESQPYPNLRVLVLKDRKVLSGRVIHPSQYLKTGYNAQARISVNHPTQVEFVLKIKRNQMPVFALDPVK